MRKIAITTLTSTARLDDDDRCTDRRTCPSVHTVADRTDVCYVVVTEVVDAAEIAAFAGLVGPGEVLGTAPRAVLDRLPR